MFTELITQTLERMENALNGWRCRLFGHRLAMVLHGDMLQGHWYGMECSRCGYLDSIANPSDHPPGQAYIPFEPVQKEEAEHVH